MNKHKRIPILPTKEWEDGATANACPLGVDLNICFCCFCCVCVFFGIGVCFLVQGVV